MRNHGLAARPLRVRAQFERLAEKREHLGSEIPRILMVYQGLAMPCCMVATPDRARMGNMAQAGAQAVWNGPDYEAFRNQLSSDQPPEVCRSCSIYSGTF